jgi:hypothetical protein
MFLTDFIKYKPFKEFLNEISAIKEVPLKSELGQENLNPSLTGNAFELFFELALSTKKVEVLFKEQFECAQKNIYNLTKLKEIHHTVDTHLSIILNGCSAPKKFNILKTELSKLYVVNSTTKPYTKSSVIVRKGIRPFQWLEISRGISQHFEIMVELNKKTGVLLLPRMGKNILVINQLGIIKHYQQVIKSFAIEADSFTTSRKISKKFTRILLQFSHISHPYFNKNLPLKNTFFVSSYLNHVHKLFSALCNNLPNLKGEIVRKPSFAYQKILATPDFLIGQKILEVKTSKKPSKGEFLQAIAYLLFAQSKENRRYYGMVESVAIFYAQCNETISFSLNELKLNKQSFKRLDEIIAAYKKDYSNKWLQPKQLPR